MPGYKAPKILRSEVVFGERRRWAFFSRLLIYLSHQGEVTMRSRAKP